MIVRIILFSFALIFFSIGSILLGCVVFPVVKIFSGNEKLCKKRCTDIINRLWYILVKYLNFTKIIEIEYDKEISQIRNKIIVASHPSFIDILVLIALIPNSLCLVKNSILKNFIMRNIVKSLYITNDNSVEDFLLESEKALNDGFNIIIFPTGKRVTEGEDVQIHKGAAKLSIHSKFPIIPIKITTSEPFLTKNQSIFQLGKNTVKFSLKIQKEIEPMSFSDKNLSEISIRNKICAIIKENI